MVPFQFKEDNSQEYLCAATALIQDTTTQLRYLVASKHFYAKKALHSQSTQMEYLDSRRGDCDAVIWGGDCNDEYKQGFPNGYRVIEEGHCFTRGQKHIDWIFFSPNVKGSRSTRTKAFVNSTMEKLDPTGYPPSDHNGEAITLQFVQEELGIERESSKCNSKENEA